MPPWLPFIPWIGAVCSLLLNAWLLYILHCAAEHDRRQEEHIEWLEDERERLETEAQEWRKSSDVWRTNYHQGLKNREDLLNLFAEMSGEEDFRPELEKPVKYGEN